MSKIPESSTKNRRGAAISASVWSAIALIVTQAMRFGGNLVMTRLLVPEYFGIMLVANTVAVVLGLLSDVGLRHKIVQSPRGDSPVFLNTAWSLQIIRGVVLTLMTILVAVLIATLQSKDVFPPTSTYADPILPWVIAVTGAVALISGVQSTKIATAMRFMQQRKLVLIEVFAQAVGLVLMVTVGYATHSIWSMVAASLVVAFVSAVLSHTWLDGQSNRLMWDRSSLRELADFGRWILLSSAVGVLATNGDRLLFGSAMSVAELGFYSIAILILSAAENAVSRMSTAVIFPVLSEAARREDNGEFLNSYYRLRLMTDLPLLFFCGFLFTAGDQLIALLYDERYQKAGEILQVLALGMFFWRFTVTHQAWLAMNLARYRAYDNIIRCLTIWSVVPALLWFGGADYAIWGVALHPLPTLLLVFYVCRRYKLLSVKKEISVLPMVFIGAATGSLVSSAIA